MIALPATKGVKIVVLGLGKSGLAAARALKAAGAEVQAWDDSERARTSAAAEGVPIADLNGPALEGAELLLMSPGIPHSFPKPHPIAARAKAAGMPLVCDIELLLRGQNAAHFIGITGTNGKSTTTALVGHILAAAKRPSEVGGNLGPAALGLKALGAGGTYVLELSSYQLELIRTAAFDVAVLLNITPDHLDRHGGMDGYVAAKRRLFDLQRPHGAAVIGIDDEHCRKIADGLTRAGNLRVLPISASRKAARGVYVLDGKLYDDSDGQNRFVVDLAEAKALPGAHNWQNAAAAFATASAVGVPAEVIARALLSYPGLPHRQETVDIIDGVRFVNDSKATNADASSKALVCYDTIYWIAGGLAKEGGIESLEPLHPRIRHAFLIGKAADDFARALDGKVAYSQCGNLATALTRAAAMAREEKISGAVVLLSPACASFDQFANFEARGDAFRDLVHGMTRRDGKPRTPEPQGARP
jgi:UDP-N-acetylmuramoylalanine--D-glutamate ligase